jgi:hypothetical protein
MSEQDPELEAFSTFIVALEPWLGEVVLVGGWAHRLYRLDPRARKLDYLPLTRSGVKPRPLGRGYKPVKAGFFVVECSP